MPTTPYPRMDPCLGRFFTVTSGYNTSIVTMSGGTEERTAHWPEAKRTWQFSTRDRLMADIQELEVFFHEMMGMHRPFRFKHWTDYQVVDGNIGTGDGTTTNYFFRKIYGVTTPRIRTNLYPIGAVVIKLDGVVVDPANYQVNFGGQEVEGGGNVEFNVAPGSGVVITATFEFDTLVRFDSDEMVIEPVDERRKYARALIGLIGVLV